MNQRADSGKKNLPGVALPPRNNKACWLLSHTAARDKDTNCNEAPPLRAIVEVNNGLPKQISAWGKQRSIYGKVIKLAGPWRTTGDWWRDDSWARDEWDVTLERQGHQTLYRIYRELNTEHWFVEGNYD